MKRILVVGELNVDLIMSGLPSLPVLGQELLCEDLRMVMGGSSSICACWMAGLGSAGRATVDFGGKVGCDPYGDFLVLELRRWGVGTDKIIRDPGIRTGVTLSLTYPHDRAMLTYLGAIADLSLSDLDLSLLKNYHHLHSASFFLQHKLRPDLPTLFRAAQEVGLTTSLDTGWDPTEEWGQDLFAVLPFVDTFFPNETEAVHLTGQGEAERAAAVLGRYARTVVVKLGREGAVAYSGGQVWRAASLAVHPVDTTGAGDAFNAGFVHAHVVEGRPLLDALRFANACGALSVTAIGGTGGICPAAEVDRFVDGARGDRTEGGK